MLDKLHEDHQRFRSPDERVQLGIDERKSKWVEYSTNGYLIEALQNQYDASFAPPADIHIKKSLYQLCSEKLHSDPKDVTTGIKFTNLVVKIFKGKYILRTGTFNVVEEQELKLYLVKQTLFLMKRFDFQFSIELSNGKIVESVDLKESKDFKDIWDDYL